MPVLQIHHQFPEENNRTEFLSQKNISSNQELREWSDDVKNQHPLPNGARWLWCEEGAEDFVCTLPEKL